MRVAKQKMQGASLVVLTGELDRIEADQVARVLDAARPVAPDHPILLLDMTNLTFADSTILALVYDAMQDLPQGSWVGLIGPSPSLTRVLSLGGLTDHPSVRMFATREEARAAVAPIR